MPSTVPMEVDAGDKSDASASTVPPQASSPRATVATMSLYPQPDVGGALLTRSVSSVWSIADMVLYATCLTVIGSKAEVISQPAEGICCLFRIDHSVTLFELAVSVSRSRGSRCQVSSRCRCRQVRTGKS